MKILKYVVVLLFGIFALVSCDKNDIDTLEQETQNQLQKSPVQEVPSGEEVDISDVLSKEPDGAETRGANVVIFSQVTNVENKKWKLFRYNKTALLPGYRYNAVITPLTSGDPDLYVYGFDAQDATPWRHIRNSITTSIDLSHLWRNELKPGEEAGYFAVYGFSAARFKIEILREDVCGREDCIGFNNGTLRIVNEGTRYLITDGVSRMLIAPNYGEAVKIFRTLKFYQLNRQCFVGRPQASFSYYTKNGIAPAGAMPGEDCVSFNLNTVEVKQVGGRWKIVDGNHWMFDFADKKEEAEQTLCLIKKYKFTKSCFVGRPDPSLQYMRR